MWNHHAHTILEENVKSQLVKGCDSKVRGIDENSTNSTSCYCYDVVVPKKLDAAQDRGRKNRACEIPELEAKVEDAPVLKCW